MKIDVHFHPDFYGEYFEKLEEGLKERDIIAVANGVNLESNHFILKYIKRHDNVFGAMGAYPIDSEKLSDEKLKESLDFIEEHLNDEKVIAIGEVGLDKKESDEKGFERQKKVFERIIALSKKYHKPLIIHSRKAERDVTEILEKNDSQGISCDMHFFSGRKSLVKRLLKLKSKIYFSIPANAKRSSQFHMVINEVPIERMLLETDGPFLDPNKEWPNYPWKVKFAIETIAEIKGISNEDVEKRIMKNFERFSGVKL